MKHPSTRSNDYSRGSALLIVLAFLLLLTTLTVAFLSRATFERQLSNASFSQGKSDLAGQGAINAIIGDLQQEIVAGSNGSGIPTMATGYYYPTNPATVIPAVVGFTPATGLEDLLKISYRSTTFWPNSANYNSTAGPQRAAPISTGTASLNNRLISNARWNKPLLLAPTSSSNYAPLSSSFVTPDWIYVARDGSNPTAWDSSYEYLPSVPPTTAPATGTPGYDPITQRYAYAIYDEGSTLDLNVAGCPVTATSPGLTYSTNQPYKNALSYADLTQLPGVSSLTATQQQAFVNAIVAWRNFASIGLTGSNNVFPNYPASVFSTTATSLSFDENVIFNPNAFLTVFTQPFGASALGTQTAPWPQTGPQAGPNAQGGGAGNQTDNAFASRQQLLQFFLQGLGQNNTFLTNSGLTLTSLVNLLPYVGTFSRDLSQPSYASPVSFASSTAPTLSNNTGTGGNSVSTNGTYTSSVDATINPAFLNVTVGSNSGTSGWTRNNGATAIAGEPLVKKRFALMRLAWLTYNGPSALRSAVINNNAASTAGGADYDIYQMENTYGIPASFLAQGTAQNIYNYFGLSWVPDPNNSGSSEWAYSHSGVYATSSSSGSILTSASSLTSATILTLPSVAGLSSGREPDFFELLKAGLCVGSLGKAYGAYNSTDNPPTPADYYAKRDQDVDNTIIQIGANIISQYQPSGYPARILYDDGLFGAAYQEHRGVVDLPYIYQVQESKMRTQDSSPAYNSCPTAGSGSGSYAVDLQVPVIWNPHAWTSTSDNSDGNPRPTNFRIYAETCAPTHDATGLSPDPTMTFYAYTCFRAANLDVYNSTDSVTAPTPASLTLTNTEMDFSIPQSTTAASDYNYLFREPTLLNKPNIPTGSTLAIGSGHTIKTALGANYITSQDAANYYTKSPVNAPDNKQYIGVVLGGNTLPLAWTEPGPNTPAGELPIGVGGLDGTNPTTANSPCTVPAEFTFVSNTNAYITYRLQYYDGKNWITYDEKYAPIITASTYNSWKNPNGGWEWTFSSVNSEIITDEGIVVCFDPRTGRWGLTNAGRNGGRPISNPSLNWMGTGPTSNPGWAAPVTGATAPNVTNAAEENAIWSARPDEYQGFIFSTGTHWSNVAWGFNTGPAAAGWYSAPSDVGNTDAVIRPGLACQNNMAVFSASANYSSRYAGDSSGIVSTFGLGCYTDPDGVVRRGMAAYVPPTSSIPASTSASGANAASGIPLKVAYTFPTANSATLTATSELASRPIMINRPFRSVADIGHVFSDTPWRNLDFSTPESGNPGFLDIFCITDTNDPNGLVAGKVNLNTRQAPVLQAILAGAYKDTFGTVPVLPGSGGTATADVIAKGLVSRTTGGTNLVNIGDLVGKWSSSVTNANATGWTGTTNNIDGSQSYIGFSGTSATTSTPSSSPQNLSSLLYSDATTNGTVAAYDTNNVNRMREVAVRALANSGTTRVWNLMIDVIAQTGRFPSSASSLANFNVEGERRYWVHVAIDRYTGKVLDEQVEELKE